MTKAVHTSASQAELTHEEERVALVHVLTSQCLRNMVHFLLMRGTRRGDPKLDVELFPRVRHTTDKCDPFQTFRSGEFGRL